MRREIAVKMRTAEFCLSQHHLVLQSSQVTHGHGHCKDSVTWSDTENGCFGSQLAFAF